MSDRDDKKDNRDEVELIMRLLGIERKPQVEGPLRPLEEIVLVIGVAHSGKSTYIAETYSDDEYDDIIDIYQYQNEDAYPGAARDIPSIRKVALSYALFECDVLDAIKHIEQEGSETGRLILEGTFLKSARRAPILQTIKNYKSDKTRLKCIWISNAEQEKMFSALDGKATFELPREDEGFDEIVFLERGRKRDEREIPDEIKDKIDARNERDRVTEGDLLGYGTLIRQASRESEKKVLDFWRGKDRMRGARERRAAMNTKSESREDAGKSDEADFHEEKEKADAQ